jgi:hypothetical protein
VEGRDWNRVGLQVEVMKGFEEERGTEAKEGEKKPYYPFERNF